ncbi:uncharacterized protein LOC117172099 [Belonocnema kinseyi]|uniref:uncharacterized protein LOC117172099 n=1 Tax=Belonocnema kinseyi TaxID=2817044 RepID=UPI00143DA5DE|nr:uncharacterized protein LOC117172099 [Belonocnema kinseyi]
MFNSGQKRVSLNSTSSTVNESSVNITTNFKSVEAILSADSDEDDLKNLIEDDSFLRNVSHNDSVFPESTDLGIINPKRISGSQIMSDIDNLRKGPMPNIPQTKKFNESIATLSQILEKPSKEITIDELAECLYFTLQTDHNSSSDHSSERDSFLSFAEISKLSDTDSINTGYNTGMELNSIAKELRRMSQLKKNIECESSPDWHSTISETPKSTFKSNKAAQSSNGDTKKEYFPMINLSGNRKSSDTIRTFAHILNESSMEIAVNEFSHVFLDTLPTDYSYVSQDSSVEDFNNTAKDLDSIIRLLRTVCRPEKNIESESSPDWHCSLTKIIKTPIDTFKPKKISNERKRKEYFPSPLFSNYEAPKEDLNLQKNSREAVTFHEKNLFSSDLRSPKINSVGIDSTHIPSVSQLRKVFSPARRAKATLNENKVAMSGSRKKEYFPMNLIPNAEFFNKDSSNNNLLSSSGIQRKQFLNQRNSKIQERKEENSLKSPITNSNSINSNKENSNRMPKVSELRKLYSPNSRRAEELQKQKLEVPRINVTKAYPERRPNRLCFK